MSGDYEVGYGKPPPEHRFKPGQSGNPRGRRRVKLTSAEMVARVRDEPITIVLGGKKVTVSSEEAAIRVVLNTCLQKGRARDLQLLLDLFEKHGAEPLEVRQENQRKLADQAIETITNQFRWFRHKDNPQFADQLRREREEAHLVMGCSTCGPKLDQRWAQEPDCGDAFRSSRFRDQVREVRYREAARDTEGHIND